jgi:hypothetical protein
MVGERPVEPDFAGRVDVNSPVLMAQLRSRDAVLPTPLTANGWASQVLAVKTDGLRGAIAHRGLRSDLLTQELGRSANTDGVTGRAA